MTNLEEYQKKKGKLPRLWIRYVDDIFAIISQEELDTMLKELNKEHKNIQFTVEVEKDGCLPFLDIHIDGEGGLP